MILQFLACLIHARSQKIHSRIWSSYSYMILQALACLVHARSYKIHARIWSSHSYIILQVLAGLIQVRLSKNLVSILQEYSYFTLQVFTSQNHAGSCMIHASIWHESCKAIHSWFQWADSEEFMHDHDKPCKFFLLGWSFQRVAQSSIINYIR